MVCFTDLGQELHLNYYVFRSPLNKMVVPKSFWVISGYFLQDGLEYVHHLFHHIMRAFVCFLSHSLTLLSFSHISFSESASSGHSKSGVYV